MAGLDDIFAPLDQRPWYTRAKDDLVDTVSNYIEGAKQGFDELARAQTQNNDTQMQQTINQLSGGNYDKNATDQSQAYENKALTNFGSETALPALAFTGVGTVPAVGAMIAKGAADTYQNTEGTPLEKAGNAVRAVTYGPAVDFATNPDLGQQFHDRPISTIAEGAMAAGQAVLPVLGAKYGIKKSGDIKTELVDHVQNKINEQFSDLAPLQNTAIQGLDALDQVDSPTRGFRPATPDEAASYAVEQKQPAMQNLISVLDQLKSQKFDEQSNAIPEQRFGNNEVIRDLPQENAQQAVSPFLQALEQVKAQKFDEQASTVPEQRFSNNEVISNLPKYNAQQAVSPLIQALEQVKAQKFDEANNQSYLDYMQRQNDEANAMQTQKNQIAGDMLFSPADRIDVGADLPIKTSLGGTGDVLGERPMQSIVNPNERVPGNIIAPEQPKPVQPGFMRTADSFIDSSNKRVLTDRLREAAAAKDFTTAAQIADRIGNPKLAEALRNSKDINNPLEQPHQDLVNAVENKLRLQSGFDPTGGRWDNTSIKGLANKAIDSIASRIWDSEGKYPTVKQMQENRSIVADSTTKKLNKLYPDSKNPANNFLRDDINPTGNNVVDALVQAKDGIKNLFSPASVDANSRVAARTMRDHGADRKLEMARTEKALQVARDSIDKLPKSQQVEIAINMQKDGHKFANPHIQGFVDTIREQLANRSQQLIDGGHLDKFNENYLPQIWKETPSNEKILAGYGKNPLNSPSGFLKAKEIPSYEVGIHLGMEPKYTNPVEMALARIGEEDKFLTGQKVIKELSANGLLADIKAGGKIPEGWKQINPDIDAKFGSSFYAPESVARVVNNSLSPSFRGAKAFSYYMNVANTMNQLQLIGGFHAGFTSLDTMVTKNTVAIKYATDAMKSISEGNYAKAGEHALEALKNIAESPISPYTNAKVGQKFKQTLLDPKHDSDPLVQMYKAGGGQLAMDAPLMTNYRQSFQKAINDNNFIGAGLRAPLAGAEKISSYIVEKLVPFQKLGAFKELAEYEIKKDPSILTDRNKMREVGAKIIDTVDNRLGQMSYDNLFWDRRLKDTLMATMRAPGWTGGTIREIGGGILDAGKDVGILAAKGAKKLGFDSELAKGDLEMSHRMAYAISLPLTTAILSSVYQYLTTGQTPQNIKDVVFPRNGNVDASGHEQRVSFPSYMKDVYHWASNPIQTGINKLHPILSTLAQLYQNKDYYGTQIANPKDSALEQWGQRAKYTANQIVPFSIKGAKQMLDNGGSWKDALLPQIGLTPAPSDISKSPAERLASEYAKARLPEGAKTQESADKSQLKGNITRDLMKGNQKTLNNALKEKQITPQEAMLLKTNSKLSPLQRSVERLTVEQAIEVYQQADSGEKTSLKVMIQKKIGNSKESAQQKTQNMKTLSSIKG
jgi:hypothetical protein